MTRFILLATLTLFFTSCYRDSTGYLDQLEGMRYTELHNIEVKSGSSQRLDLDGDGRTDFSFSTLLVGDPLLMRDRLQYYVNSTIKTSLLNDSNDETPVLEKGAIIMQSHPGYFWYDISAIVLTEKITPLTPPAFWQGRWKDAFHKYLPVQIEKQGNFYLGWIELSFDKAGGKLVIHRAALSREPGKSVKAGY